MINPKKNRAERSSAMGESTGRWEFSCLAHRSRAENAEMFGWQIPFRIYLIAG